MTEAATRTDAFEGFPNSGLATPVPNLFFARVMPEIEAVEELIVTAYFFYAQTHVRRSPRFLTLQELEADGALLRTLARLCGGHDGEALRRGLDLAVRRGALFESSIAGGQTSIAGGQTSIAGGQNSMTGGQTSITGGQTSSLTPSEWPIPGGQTSSLTPQPERLFTVNTPANRKALAALDTTGIRVETPLPPAQGTAAPDIFTLYEQNVGNITPLIADDLKEAEDRYPPEWVRAAFHEAVAANKRSWRYIARILQRWETEGPDYEKPEGDTEREWLARRYAAGKRSSRA